MAATKLPLDHYARTAIWSRLGWTELSKPDETTIWERFDRAFGFFGTGIREPVPSGTWDANWVYESSRDGFDEASADLNAKFLRALAPAPRRPSGCMPSTGGTLASGSTHAAACPAETPTIGPSVCSRPVITTSSWRPTSGSV